MSQTGKPRRSNAHASEHFTYVRTELDGQLVDAQVIAQKDDLVLLVYPQQAGSTQPDDRAQSRWVPFEQVLRIRREDSSWNNADDDIDWHETQDGY